MKAHCKVGLRVLYEHQEELQYYVLITCDILQLTCKYTDFDWPREKKYESYKIFPNLFTKYIILNVLYVHLTYWYIHVCIRKYIYFHKTVVRWQKLMSMFIDNAWLCQSSVHNIQKSILLCHTEKQLYIFFPPSDISPKG